MMSWEAVNLPKQVTFGDPEAFDGDRTTGDLGEEKETVSSIINGIRHLKEYTFENSDAFSRELLLAFMSQISVINIVFSGKEQNHLGSQLDRELKRVIFRKYPEYEKDPEKNIFLSYCIQGAYHAYLSNPEADTEVFVRTVEKIVKCLRPLV